MYGGPGGHGGPGGSAINLVVDLVEWWILDMPRGGCMVDMVDLVDMVDP